MRVTEDSPHQPPHPTPPPPTPYDGGFCKEPTDSRTVAGLHCQARKTHLGPLITFNCGRQRRMEKRLRASRLRTNVRRQTTALDSQSALMTANQRCFVCWGRSSRARRLQEGVACGLFQLVLGVGKGPTWEDQKNAPRCPRRAKKKKKKSAVPRADPWPGERHPASLEMSRD